MKTQAILFSVTITAIALAAYLAREALGDHSSPSAGCNKTEPGCHAVANPTTVAGSSQGFGPVFETVLPGPASDGTSALLDLKTGRWMLQPDDAQPNSSADAIMAWIRTNRLDISGKVWPEGGACVTYNMTLVPVEARCWDDMTVQQLLGNKALATDLRAPRRLLVLGQGRAEAYLFRTADGSLGVLRLVGLSADGQGVKIQYKLIEKQGAHQTKETVRQLSPISAISSVAQGKVHFRKSCNVGEQQGEALSNDILASFVLPGGR